MSSMINHITAAIVPHGIEARCLILILAIIVDGLFGDPEWVWRRIPHPTVLFGRAISAADNWGNKRTFSGVGRRLRGNVATAALILAAGLVASGIMAALTFTANPRVVTVLTVILVAILLAGRSLNDHVRRVLLPLQNNDLSGARHAISMIVGRNSKNLNAAAISRAAIETTAENLSDGVIAPAIFYLAFGLPGIIIYKMINTADSMIGYKSKTYYAFGTGAARVDDFANFIPARVTAVLVALARPSKTIAAAIVMRRDASGHRSPNAGWPESAMAAVLELSLGGARRYGTRMSNDKALNLSGRRNANADDIILGLTVMWRAIAIFITILLLVFLIGAALF
ncbi:MAG: adenosylcobinamide-phosphate synthase CbiB [Candidatus Puniceispirillales bacterium WSBS_2018_MAG_OTU23]